MLIELDVARARLSLRSKVAAAVRRLCGLEMTPTGYRTMARGKRMEHRVRAPDNVEIHVLHFNRDGTVTVEFEDNGVVKQIAIPQIELTRRERRAGRKR